MLLFYNFFVYSLLLILRNGFAGNPLIYIAISFLITADFLKAAVI